MSQSCSKGSVPQVINIYLHMYKFEHPLIAKNGSIDTKNRIMCILTLCAGQLTLVSGQMTLMWHRSEPKNGSIDTKVESDTP